MDQAFAGPWPCIREDLTLYAGPADIQGSPVWTVHDPARNQYFQIDWVAFEIISRLSLGTVEAICGAINEQTTLHVDTKSVESVIVFLKENELLTATADTDIEWYEKKHRARSKNFATSLMHSYLFYRVPLFNPDRLLEGLLPKVRYLLSKNFLHLTLLVFIVGAWQVWRQWATFETTLIDTFSLDGLLGYTGALIAVKILHEFGHALVAKKCGCRVPAMGVAFLVMWPMAYTDVTESWKLDSHRKRLMIASAGIATELTVAAWSIFLWGLLPEGGAKNVCFFLGTASILATLAINASPFMRFDGYFLLSDILGIPNLHQRSFAYARWWLREKLFNFGDPIPEPLNVTRQHFFLVFAITTWIYRLIVFVVIALIVYFFFFKALGVVLFAIEIWFFLLRPIAHEFSIWRKRLAQPRTEGHRVPAFYILLGLILIFVVPFDFTVNAQGMLKPERSFSVMTPVAAQIVQLPQAEGSRIKSGALLAGLESPEIAKRTMSAEVRIDSLIRQVGGVGFDKKLVAQQPILKAQLQSLTEELEGLNKESARLRPIAPFDGVISDVTPDLYLGEWVPKAHAIVTLIDDSSWVVDTYVDEADLKRLAVGNRARFVPEGQGLSAMVLRVIRIDRDATRLLGDGALSSVSNGEILVRLKDDRLIPERAVYRVRLKVESDLNVNSHTSLRGRVVIAAWPKSLVGDFLRGVFSTLIREVSF